MNNAAAADYAGYLGAEEIRRVLDTTMIGPESQAERLSRHLGEFAGEVRHEEQQLLLVAPVAVVPPLTPDRTVRRDQTTGAG